MENGLIVLSFRTGHLSLMPFPALIIERTRGPRFWRTMEYFVENDVMRIGPYQTRDEAESMARLIPSYRSIEVPDREGWL